MPIRPPTRLLSPILLERDRLIGAIRQTINQTFSAAEAGCVGQAGEVDKLVYFFLEGLPLIEDQFNRILEDHGVQSTLSGIFCHQTPKVTPSPHFQDKNRTCELGDILFLVTYGRRLHGSFIGNAILVQAKESVGTLGGTLQEHLYAKATDFTYALPGALANQQRFLHECHNALWFWGFDDYPQWAAPIRWQTSGLLARGRRAPRMPFENVLGDLICGVTGRRARMLTASSTDSGWSKIVDDLIRHTARKTFTRQNAYVSRDKEPMRGEDAVRAINSSIGFNSPFLIRSSLGRIFSIFDDELAKLGIGLEEQGQQFDTDKFKHQHHERFQAEERDFIAPPPILGNERPRGNDDDGGGCSFVIMDFSHR